MKNIVKISIIMSLTIVLVACKSNNSSKTQEIKRLETFYSNLNKDEDISSATFVARQILALDSTKYYLLDSLTVHYAALGNLKATEKYLNLALAQHPNNKKLLEIKGQIAISKNDTKGAMASYEEAYKLKKDDKLLMAMNNIHLKNKDFGKSDSITKLIKGGKYLVQIVDDLLKSKQNTRGNKLMDRILKEFAKSDETYPMQSNQKGDIQEVKVAAVVYFIKAQMAASKNDVKGYSYLLNKALKLQPDFLLAKMAKQQLAGMMRGRR